MKENYRQLYLSALAVENYMPRWILPGAPLATPCEWEVVAEDVVIAEEGSDALATADAVREYPASKQPNLVLEEFKHPSNAATDRAAKRANKTSQSAQEILQRRQNPAVAARYSLTLWQITSDLLILDSRQAELALPTESLLQNIIRAAGFSARLPKADLLRWPLVDSLAVAADVQQAREHLAALLSAKLSTVTDVTPSVWILGETAAQYFLPEDLKYQETNGRCFPLSSEWFGSIEPLICVTPSLVDMLQDPNLKRITWKALREWKQACGNS